MTKNISSPPCHDMRDCFAKAEYRKQKRCLILTTTYMGDYECPFCKERIEDVQQSTDSRGTKLSS